jgi:hypothetical protein
VVPVNAAVEAPLKAMLHLTDRTALVQPAGGTHRIRMHDAVAAARHTVPTAYLIRVLPGDSLAKIALQYDIPLRRLSILNRASERRVFGEHNIVCLDWKHCVQAGETRESVAKLYNTLADLIEELNDRHLSEQLVPGQWIRVPGEFSYHDAGSATSFLRIAKYQSPSVGIDPVRPGSDQTRTRIVQPGDTLARLAHEYQVPVHTLQLLNHLAADEEPAVGQTLLMEWTILLADGASLDDVLSHFQVGYAQLLKLNQLQRLEDFDRTRRLWIPIRREPVTGGRSPRNQSGKATYRVTIGTEPIAIVATDSDGSKDAVEGGHDNKQPQK